MDPRHKSEFDWVQQRTNPSADGVASTHSTLQSIPPSRVEPASTVDRCIHKIKHWRTRSDLKACCRDCVLNVSDCSRCLVWDPNCTVSDEVLRKDEESAWR